MGKSRRAAADLSAIIIQFRRGRGNYFARTRVPILRAISLSLSLSLSLFRSRCLFRSWINVRDLSTTFLLAIPAVFPAGLENLGRYPSD